MCLPEKGSSSTSLAPSPAEATAFEPAFSDDDEEASQVNDLAAAPAVATAEAQNESLPQNAEAGSSSTPVASDKGTGENC